MSDSTDINSTDILTDEQFEAIVDLAFLLDIPESGVELFFQLVRALRVTMLRQASEPAGV